MDKEAHWREQAHLAHADWVATEVKLSEAQAALKAAHHKLTFLNGLWATDLVEEKGAHAFCIDNYHVLSEIEKVLEGD